MAQRTRQARLPGMESAFEQAPDDRSTSVQNLESQPADRALANDKRESSTNKSPFETVGGEAMGPASDFLEVDDAPAEAVAGDPDAPAVDTLDLSAAPPTSLAVAGADDVGQAPASLFGKTVYVVDLNSLLFQVFHAIPQMTSPKGEPVNAVFGFTRDLLYLLQEKKPDYLFCALDMPGPTFRHERYTDYKVHRTEMPDELASQTAHVYRMVTALGVPLVGLESFEADDILATISCHTQVLGGECVLVTNDKDCRQLLGERCRMYNIRKDAYFDAESLLADWGIRPEQVVDFQALVGDPVDHVPGVPLIGPKAARELLEKYGTLECILDHAHEVAGAKKRQNLLEGRDTALLSRDLVRLETAVPVRIPWDQGQVGGQDAGAVKALCTELGFHRFAEQVQSLGAKARTPAPLAPAWVADYRIVDTPEAFDSFVKQLAAAPTFAFDTETTSLGPIDAELVGCSFSWEPGVAWYVPVRGPAEERVLDSALVLDRLRPILENAAVAKVGQNLKYDMIVLRTQGVRLRGVVFDTMIASYLLDAGELKHNLDELARRYLNHENIKISEVIGTGKSQKRMDEVPVALVGKYAAEDADVALRLWPILAARLAEDELVDLYRQLELPLIDVLAELEFNGIHVDVPRLEALSGQYGERIAALESEVHSLAGHPFNIASTRQLQQVLFDEQKLPVHSRTKTGPCTDVAVLEDLAKIHPLPRKIIEFRQFSKLKNTYVDALPRMVSPRTGRVHASFQQAVAATGRLSSSDPNLQNIPVRETGREIRSAFLPGPPATVLLAADYSQIELRVLAHYSGDPELCKAFADGDDIHLQVAGQIHGVPPAEVTREMRRKAKAVNFGVIYGQSAFGLARALDIDKQEAARFIEAYFARFPGVSDFIGKTLEDARQRGYVTTILGRRRAIRGVRDSSARQRTESVLRQPNLPERTAVNTVIQGSAADLIKLAMVAIHKRLAREGLGAKMLLQIHDELVFETTAEALEPLTRLVTEEMSEVASHPRVRMRVPLGVVVHTGPNWAEV